MRVSEFSLEKYGVFDQLELKLSPDAGLTVIYGPNEAGKSTLLAAVSDFLFRIEAQTPYGSVFGYDAIRLGATLRLASGAELVLRRRKANKTNLSDGDGRPVGDDALAGVLGGTSRERFEALFGLNHETLRGGGERLLSADGDIGRLIVEAGGGLRALVDRVDRLDERMDTLFSTRRAERRAFYQAADKLQAADVAIRETQVTREAFAKAEEALDSAQVAYESLRDIGRERERQKASLARMKRVAPLIRQLRSAESDLTTLSDLPDLASEFKAQVEADLKRLQDAHVALTRANDTYGILKAKLDQLAVDDRWLRLEAKVSSIATNATVVQTARAGLPNRRNDLAESEGRLEYLRHLIGAAEISDLTKRAPSAAAIDELKQLRNQAVTRTSSLTAKRDRLNALIDELGLIEVRLVRAKNAGFDEPLDIRADDFAALPRDAGRVSTQLRLAADKATMLEERAIAIGVASVKALRAIAAPKASEIQSEIGAQAKLANDRESQAEKVREAKRAIGAAEREIERLQRSGEIPSEAAIVRSRDERLVAITPVKRAYIDGAKPGTATSRAAEFEAIDGAIDHADRLVDRRSAEAHRIAALDQQERTLEEAISDKEEAQNEMVRLGGLLETRVKAFSGRYSEAAGLYPDLSMIRPFVDERQQILDGASSLATERMAIDLEQSQVDVQLVHLTHAEAKLKLKLATGSESNLAVRARAVVEAIRRHDEAHAHFLGDRDTAASASREKVSIESEVAELERQHGEWLPTWDERITPIGVQPDASLEHAETVTLEWAKALGELANRAQILRRLERMAEDEAVLGRLVKEVSSSLDLTLDGDVVIASGEIVRLAGANEATQIKRDGLEPQVAAAAEAEKAAQEEVEAASTALDVLRTAAGVTDDGALIEMAELNTRRHNLKSTIVERRESVSLAGDSLTVEALIEEWAERDLDTLAAELGAIAQDEARHDNEVRSAITNSHDARALLGSYETSEGIGTQLMARESAIAELRAVVEEWLELSLTKDLLADAIATVRGNQQDPLVKRAGEFFQRTTRGAFKGIDTDVDDKGKPVVVGRRADGSLARMSALSDGTRDQLFLAFRLASLERYAEVAEPLPFIADDILVHFDDERAEASLELLANFGEKNQVLLFTHHASVRDAAVRVAAKGGVQVLSLG
jgi:uncharacterized protein YhaN